jgi:cytochrome P450
MGLLRDPLRTLDEHAARSDGPLVFRVGRRRVAFLRAPGDVRSAFIAQRSRVGKGDTLDGLRLVLGSGLITVDGPEHLRQRRAMSPAFAASHAAAWGDAVAATAERHVAGWTDGDVVAIDEEMLALSLVAAGLALFEHDLAPVARPVGAALRQLSDLSILASVPFAGALSRSPLPFARRFRSARTVLHDAVAPIVDAAPSARPGSVLAAVRDLASAVPAAERAATIRDQVLTLLVAGHVTTGNALAWAAWLLACNPDAQARLETEVDDAAGDRSVRGSDVSDLPWARAVFAESLRLYPPAWAIGRRATDDVRLDGCVMPKGSLIVATPWLTHRDARYHANPHRFDPDRWMVQDSHSAPAGSYYPFGVGSRKCVGEPLAWLEGALVLAAVARGWRLHPPGDGPVVPRPEITLSPKGRLRMRVEARQGVRPSAS